MQHHSSHHPTEAVVKFPWRLARREQAQAAPYHWSATLLLASGRPRANQEAGPPESDRPACADFICLRSPPLFLLLRPPTSPLLQRQAAVFSSHQTDRRRVSRAMDDPVQIRGMVRARHTPFRFASVRRRQAHPRCQIQVRRVLEQRIVAPVCLLRPMHYGGGYTNLSPV